MPPLAPPPSAPAPPDDLEAIAREYLDYVSKQKSTGDLPESPR